MKRCPSCLSAGYLIFAEFSPKVLCLEPDCQWEGEEEDLFEEYEEEANDTTPIPGLDLA